MSQKSILVAVADTDMSGAISQALGAAWETVVVPSDTEALEQLEKRSFDALLVDFNLGSPDASDLLNAALTKRPETVRFLLAYEADLALVAAKVDGPHQLLPKPLEPDSLSSRIESGLAPEPSNSEQKANEPASELVIPPVYAEVLKALEAPGVKTREVAQIIGSDAALLSEVLRLTNSSYQGLPRKITNPVKAVESLGLEAVKVLVLALRFLAEHSRLSPGYLSFEQLWQHSINVAQLARALVLFETKDRVLASQALAAGLVHDLGKVVLVQNFDDLYARVHSLARKQPVALWDIEKEMFGANHGEIGACLLGMWNLPGYIVDAVALHHEPPVGEQQQFTPLAAVHIANVLEHEVRPSDESRVAPIIHTPFLNDLGLLARLPVWRAAFANRRAATAGPELEPVEIKQAGSTVLSGTSQTGNLLAGPIAATSTGTTGQPESGGEMLAYLQKRWVSAGVAAGLLILLALWRGTPGGSGPVPVNARTPAPNPAPLVAASSPESEKTPDLASSQPTTGSETSAATAPEPVVSTPPPEPVPASAPPAAITNAAPLSVTPRPPSDFRLSGIIYTGERPSAILNGETVYIGDEVNGATVLSIGRTSVTLRIKGQRKTFTLR